MANFDRIASGTRFEGIGVRTTDAPDAMPPNRSPFLQNLRNFSKDHLRSRPQLDKVTNSPGGLLLNIVSLEANLGLYRTEGGALCSGGAVLETGYSSTGSSLIPFRPNASPQAYEYVYDANKARKVGPLNAISNIGIPEPQANVEAVVQPAFYFNDFTPASAPTPAGTAGAVTAGPGGSSTISNVFFITEAGVTEQYLTFTTPTPLQIGATIVINGTEAYVADSIPGFSQIGISGIYYYSGTTGRCVIVPQNMAEGPGQEVSIYAQNFMQYLRRGAIIQIGSEVCQVLTTSTGPNGTLCFETITTNNHTTADTITGLPTLKTSNTSAVVGQTITIPTPWQSTITSGVGTLSWNVSSSPFVHSNYALTPYFSFQPDDYCHFGIQCQYLENINEIKIIFDVNNGTADFTSNAYFYTIRPSDIQAGIQNTLTQLGVAQIVAQRALIDEEKAVAVNNQGTTVSSGQTMPGDGQVSQISFPISSLTRIGTDETRSLANVQAVQILINASGTTVIGFDSTSVYGGGQLDVGATGIPVKYKIRPRSSVTGAMGNPSPEMRYSITARRDNPTLALPTGYSDAQVDYWDVFRQGGALPNYTFIGSVPISTGFFTDQFNDAAVAADNTLQTTLYQPFPTIDYPLSGTANIVGTACVLTVTSSNPAANIVRYLPGNIVTVGQQDYTLWCRPIQISSSTYFLQFNENAGVYNSSQLNIYEPLMAQQFLPYCWGPDANGRIFGVGDTYRPGFVYTTNPNDPDSTADNAEELCPPTEPLQNGALIGGTSVAASVNRWWRGYPQDDGSYNWTEIPVGHGLEFPWAITSDGKAVYFVGKDGIYMHAGGPAQSLTDDDLYNLFPHEDVYPQTITYNGNSIIPPGYQWGNYFRLCVVNGFLFFDYLGIDNNFHTLVCNLATKAWIPDVYSDPVTVRSTISSPPGVTSSLPNQQMFCGSLSGAIYNEVSNPIPGSGEVVQWVIATSEDMLGDLRAPKLFGDAALDILPAGSGITATPTFLGVAFGTSTSIATSSTRLTNPVIIDLLGGQYSRSMGLIISGSDQGNVTKLYSWQPSYVSKVEYIADRFEDWNNCGTDQNKWFQGFILEANTNNTSKSLVVRDADTLATHAFVGPQTVSGEVLHDGQSTLAYSFVQPFRAHMVRYEAENNVNWQCFGIRYIFEPTPEFALNWFCQPTAWGIDGYKHMQRVLLALCSTSVVTLTIVVDGRTYSYSIPSTGGAYAKSELIFNPLMKGLIYTVSATSSEPFAVWSDDAEWLVKPWMGSGPYQRMKIVGSTMGNSATI